MRVSQIRMIKWLLIVHYLDPNILSIEILEHIKPARWASLINLDPLQQALLVEHMLTLNLKQILALAQVGDADGAFFFGHFGSEGNGVDAITDGLPYLVLLETNAALSEAQVDAGEEGADEGVHVDEEVAVEVGELGGHDSPDIVAIIIINMIKREDGFDGGGRAGDDAGHSETPLDEGVGVTEHEEDEHHGDDEEVDEQEASEPQFRRLHQVLMLGQGEMGEEEQGSERNCCHHTPGDLDMGYHYYIISPPRPIGFLTNSPHHRQQDSQTEEHGRQWRGLAWAEWRTSVAEEMREIVKMKHQVVNRSGRGCRCLGFEVCCGSTRPPYFLPSRPFSCTGSLFCPCCACCWRRTCAAPAGTCLLYAWSCQRWTGSAWCAWSSLLFRSSVSSSTVPPRGSRSRCSCSSLTFACQYYYQYTHSCSIYSRHFLTTSLHFPGFLALLCSNWHSHLAPSQPTIIIKQVINVSTQTQGARFK